MSQYIKIDFDSVKHSTPGAILFDLGDDEEIWIPISMIDMEQFDPDNVKTVLVKEWFALRKGLI